MNLIVAIMMSLFAFGCAMVGYEDIFLKSDYVEGAACALGFIVSIFVVGGLV